MDHFDTDLHVQNQYLQLLPATSLNQQICDLLLYFCHVADIVRCSHGVVAKYYAKNLEQKGSVPPLNGNSKPPEVICH